MRYDEERVSYFLKIFSGTTYPRKIKTFAFYKKKKKDSLKLELLSFPLKKININYLVSRKIKINL